MSFRAFGPSQIGANQRTQIHGTAPTGAGVWVGRRMIRIWANASKSDTT